MTPEKKLSALIRIAQREAQDLAASLGGIAADLERGTGNVVHAQSGLDEIWSAARYNLQALANEAESQSADAWTEEKSRRAATAAGWDRDPGGNFFKEDEVDLDSDAGTSDATTWKELCEQQGLPETACANCGAGALDLHTRPDCAKKNSTRA